MGLGALGVNSRSQGGASLNAFGDPELELVPHRANS